MDFTHDQNILDFKHKNSIDIILSNARSLLPKLDSMVEIMQELECEISIVTETWFKSGTELDKKLAEMQAQTGYGVVKRNRGIGRGGGVAIIYKKGDLQMTEIKTSSNYEVVAAMKKVKDAWNI